MKKLLLILLFLFITIEVYSKEEEIKPKNDSNYIDLFCKQKCVGSYTLVQFEELLSNNQIILDLTEAEKNARVEIYLSDKEYTFKDGVYIGLIYIQWKKEEEKSKKLIVIKEIKIKATLRLQNVEPSIFEQIDNFYGTVAKIGFPIVLILIIIGL
jgi:hypothetical protein